MTRGLNYLVGFMALFIATGAFAASTEDARHFADAVGSQVLKVVNDTGKGEAQKEQDLRQVFQKNVDIPWMGNFALGAAARQMTPEQRERYLAAYQKYMLSHYTQDLSDYSGSKYTITNASDDGNGQFTVNMKINSPNASDQKETQAGYRLRAGSDGQLKIFDIIVEGVSQITTQRSDFTSVVQRGGMDTLIQDLESKAQNEPKKS